MTNTHDLRATFIDFRDRYMRSGWVDQGLEEMLREMGRRLKIEDDDDDQTEIAVRCIVSDCVWLDPNDDRKKTREMERKSVKRLMRLIRHREGRHCAE